MCMETQKKQIQKVYFTEIFRSWASSQLMQFSEYLITTQLAVSKHNSYRYFIRLRRAHHSQASAPVSSWWEVTQQTDFFKETCCKLEMSQQKVGVQSCMVHGVTKRSSSSVNELPKLVFCRGRTRLYVNREIIIYFY